MGEAVDNHQARLDSINSCRCGERSRAEIQRNEDTRSELSYADPEVPGASPASIPTSAVSEVWSLICFCCFEANQGLLRVPQPYHHPLLPLDRLSRMNWIVLTQIGCARCS